MNPLTTAWLKASWRRMARFSIAACAAAAGFALTLAVMGYAFAPALDTRPYTAVDRSGELIGRSGRLLYAFLNTGDQWCFPRPLDQLNPHLVNATVATEDQRFRRHYGIDPAAVLRAFWQNLRHRGVASGASTITMQVVKITEDGPAGKPGRGLRERVETKLRQAWRALLLERAASKNDILDAYLNKAPYGLNLIGAEAAARRYFGKPAAELTLPEAALLAGLPKAPTAFEPLSHPERALARRNHVLARMLDEGYVTEQAYREAKEAPLGTAWNDFPQSAPHLAMWLRGAVRAKGALQVTLDEHLQKATEDLLERYLKRFDNEITNAAVMVADAASATVVVRAGSADFFSTPGGGQVDLCSAPRSPGSTLKPFTYALAIERNLLYPSEQLLDDTLDFGNYNPANFNGEYNGLVSAQTALQYSLNVPAVAALERTGPEALVDLLRKTGLTTLVQSPEYYGLGLTLGNCEVRLDELTAAYCALANLGAYRPLRIYAGAPEPAPKSILSRGTALALYQMLEAPFPGEMGDGVVRAKGILPRVCWKTGTSTGYRDAWTFAFNAQYIVGVWLGNNNAKSSRRLVGAQAALPLAAAIFRSLPPNPEKLWPEPGQDLREVRVCSISGLPATEWCKSTKTVLLPSNLFTNRRCGVHAPGETADTIVERWPGSAHGWDLANILSPVTIRPDTASQPANQEFALKIKIPANNAQYVVTGEPDGDRLKLSASLDERSPLHWYVDDLFVGTSGPERQLFLDLIPGKHKIACMTPDGQTDTAAFEVLTPSSDVALRTE